MMIWWQHISAACLQPQPFPLFPHAALQLPWLSFCSSALPAGFLGWSPLAGPSCQKASCGSGPGSNVTSLKDSAWVCQLPFSLWATSLFFIALFITCNDPVHSFIYWFSICSNKEVEGGQKFYLSCLLLYLQNHQSHQPFGSLNKYMWMELLSKFS